MKKIIVVLYFVFALCLLSCSTPPILEPSHIGQNDSIETKIGIKMVKEQGIYKIPCSVNGVNMKFIFDTGASSVCISKAEALFLYKNGYIDDDDLGDNSYATVADGRVVENRELNIRCIEIAGIVLTDVSAVITQSIEAPLLLGQSAIAKLGKYQIEGDSLFIFSKTIAPIKNIAISKNKKRVTAEVSLWDRIKSYFDNNEKQEKIDEYLESASDAWLQDMNELAIDYCVKAYSIDTSNWVPIALGGYLSSLDDSYDNNKDTELVLERADELNVNNDYYVFKNGRSISGEDIKYYLAVVRCRNKNYSQCILSAQKILENNPTCQKAMDIIALAYFLDGKDEQAKKWANKMIAISNDDVSYFRLGYIYHKNQELNKAAKYYEKALEKNPNNYKVLNNLAMIYYSRNRGLAERMMKKSAKLGCKRSEKWIREDDFSRRVKNNWWYED